MMVPINFIRLSDDLFEQLAVFASEAGEITVSTAFFKTLMDEAGWKLREKAV